MRTSRKLFANCPWENGDNALVEQKALIGNYNNRDDGAKVGKVGAEGSQNSDLSYLKQSLGQDIFKAYIPWFLYKPPFGYTRTVNPLQMRLFAENPYIFSVIKAIQDAVSTTPYDIVLKEEYAKEDKEYDDVARKGILNFFDKPNDNPFETFPRILKQWVKDIGEVGNSIGVKVFNKQGEFTQLVARDASTFLLNTDIHGMLGNRDDYIKTPTVDFLTQGLPTDRTAYNKLPADKAAEKIADDMKQGAFQQRYSETAAYFQYGWTAGARPVPFGKREVIWIDMNPRTNNIYPQSPIEVLWNTILTLVYGGEYNLDFYLNNNLPNGMLWFEGCTGDQAEMYRTQLDNQVMEHDEFNNVKKKHFKVPVTAHKPEFIQMQMTSKEMEVIEQQKWFVKLLYACFGLNENEMGFVENVNKANGENQSEATVRKMVRPFLSAIELAINAQLMPEFNCPEYEFKFINYSIDEDVKKHNLLEQQLRMGVKNQKMVARELGIDYDEVLEDQIIEGEDGSMTGDDANNSYEDQLANGIQAEMQNTKDPKVARKLAEEKLKKNPKEYDDDNSEQKKEKKAEKTKENVDKKAIDIDKAVRDNATNYHLTYKQLHRAYTIERENDFYEDPLILINIAVRNLLSNQDHYNVTKISDTQEQS